MTGTARLPRLRNPALLCAPCKIFSSSLFQRLKCTAGTAAEAFTWLICILFFVAFMSVPASLLPSPPPFSYFIALPAPLPDIAVHLEDTMGAVFFETMRPRAEAGAGRRVRGTECCGGQAAAGSRACCCDKPASLCLLLTRIDARCLQIHTLLARPACRSTPGGQGHV